MRRLRLGLLGLRARGCHDAAWADEMARVAVAPPVAVPGISTAERRRRTDRFLAAVLTAPRRQDAVDLMHAAVAAHRTLRPRHVAELLRRGEGGMAPAAGLWDGPATAVAPWCRAVTALVAASDAEATARREDPSMPAVVTGPVLTDALRVVLAVVDAAAPCTAATAAELEATVGRPFVAEPHWALAALCDRRGLSVTSAPVVRRLRQDTELADAAAVPDSEADLSPRAEFVLRMEACLAGDPAAGPGAHASTPADRAPAPHVSVR